MLLKLAKKITLLSCCTYSCIGLASLSAVLSTNTSALTQVVGNSSIQKKPIAIPIPSPSPVTSSKLIWPTQGYISQGFRQYRHEGIDIAGASGTPILAAAGGKVVKAGWDEWGLGNAIEIKHPNGSATVYGHNRRLLVSKDQQVKQGQIIAEMGSTGNSTAPHLHFEYYPNGRVAVNPTSFFASSTANKNPSQSVASNAAKAPQATTPNIPVAKPLVEQAVSPSQQIPVAFAPTINETKCTGSTLLEGETANVLVRVCDENGRLFYIGELKQNPNEPVKIPAWSIGQNRYQADNGTFSYVVSPEQVEIWRNGSQLRTDSFYTFNK
ncbi:peptidoglycan DD-metalloendopeptidase family protein [Anabaena subtropica]|uniref:Peptidoglycan DD-metalloendopeptidase family protein n=1 Tax=Anabaena subtropica FACHB-260 TaxID=2692884 RepID=A0ABR8CS42_9NOST|nr:peptidoglycan DD-metalloendopeptidase family protein [Anabaena subtropica]MBD2346022.1 peptidoglycan DD-metalloendopeptidase family protein [Anabaena subtropica FACHB-260]